VFDDQPFDEERYPCPRDCGGEVTRNKDDEWECDTCDFVKAALWGKAL